MTTTPTEEERRLARLVRAHDRWRGRQVFNLLPSENAVSPTARKFLASDLAGRYTLPLALEVDGEKVDNGYTGTRYTDQIEALATAAARRVFRARCASVRPLSGHIAALSVLGTLFRPGARLLAIAPDAGGYDGYAASYVPALLDFTVQPLPANGPGHAVEAEAAVATIQRERPQAVVLGQSFFLFPYPLREIAEAAHAVGALVLYDASHVLGLIAGGEFQDPLREGADVVYGSTHKSFPGPQGGLIVTDREDLFQRIDPALVWRVFDNAHWNRIAALGQTLLELERFAPEYAKTVVANALALGGALEAEGIPIVAGPDGCTRSHQLHVDRARLRSERALGPVELARRLERQGLLIDLVARLGTAEATRLGLTPADMPRLAKLVAAAGLRKEKVASEVRTWRRTFRGLRFV